MNEEIAVRKANEAFYAAMENLDIKNMESVWLREPYITCAHAGWPLLEGWGPIMKSWERIFDQTFEMKILINEIRVRVSGDIVQHQNISHGLPQFLSVRIENLFY